MTDSAMKKIYIASPYTGQEEAGVQRQIEVASELISLGYAPFWPLSSHFLNQHKYQDYNVWLRLDFAWIDSCDALLRLPGESNGADLEVAHAGVIGIPVFYSVEGLVNG